MKANEQIKWLERYKKGEEAAFNAIYTAFSRKIFTYIYYKTLHLETAEDLASQTFIRALENIGKYDAQKGAFSTWLFTIARNLVTDYYRSRQSTAYIIDIWDLPESGDVQLDVENKILFEKLKALIQKLPDHQREIIILRVWENLPYKEIAVITGKSEASCKMMFSRTISALKELLPASAVFLIFFKINWN